MEDFASSLGLAASQRERLLQQLGVEDQELLEAKQLVTWLPGTGRPTETMPWKDGGLWCFLRGKCMKMRVTCQGQ